MLIVCPSCEAAYQVKPDALGAAGRSVRCVQCKNTWFATAESAVQEPAMAMAVVAAPARAPAPAAPPDNFEAAAGDFTIENVPPPEEVDQGESTVVADAPPLVPDQGTAVAEAAVHKFEPGVPDRAETVVAKRTRHVQADRQAQRNILQRVLSLPMLIVVLLSVVLAALNWRASMVRQFPQTASLYAAVGLTVNLRGLTFENVKSTGEFHDGVNVLVVEGMIVNLTRNTLEVPRLRLALRNAAGHEVYAWTAMPPKTSLGSGNGLPFRARLASPPPDGRDVIVRFLNRRDVAAGS